MGGRFKTPRATGFERSYWGDIHAKASMPPKAMIAMMSKVIAKGLNGPCGLLSKCFPFPASRTKKARRGRVAGLSTEVISGKLRKSRDHAGAECVPLQTVPTPEWMAET